jgi:hypothetical protein
LAFSATKLTADLIFANKAACDAVENISDGGTANLDSVFLRVPRIRETVVLEAIKKAGLYCRAKRRWIGEGYMITPTTGGQGDKRSIGVEKMKEYLKSQGWDVLLFCHND